jgi:Helix-turn-helix of DDE superfamily endonuclease
MNTYKRLSSLSDELFRRKTGVKRKTFERMIYILKEAELEKKKDGGKPNKLVMEERLIMWLEYMREYRTYFHTGASFGISESACFRNCVWIEDTLIESKEFSLPKRTAPLKSENEIEVVVVDATESPIERPQKNKGDTTQERKRSIRSKHR